MQHGREQQRRCAVSAVPTAAAVEPQHLRARAREPGAWDWRWREMGAPTEEGLSRAGPAAELAVPLRGGGGRLTPVCNPHRGGNWSCPGPSKHRGVFPLHLMSSGESTPKSPTKAAKCKLACSLGSGCPSGSPSPATEERRPHLLRPSGVGSGPWCAREGPLRPPRFPK